MAWETVGPADALPDGEMVAFPREHGAVVVCRMGENFFALEDRCPHANGPLSMGNFSPPFLVCPWHAWEFDCRGGQCVRAEDAAIRRYPVEIRDGAICVEFPDA